MVNIQDELNLLCDSEEKRKISRSLMKNKWKCGATTSELHMGWGKISPIRKRLRNDLVVNLWRKYDLNLSEIEKMTGISRKTASRILRPLGYQPKRDHKAERKAFLDNAYHSLLQAKQPLLTELDDFIVSQQFNGILNYAEAKERVYNAFPDLAKAMKGKMTYLSSKRKNELGITTKLTHTCQARKAFLEGLKLDFPGTNILQRAAIMEGHPERIHHLRDLSDDELSRIKAKFEKGSSITQLANEFDVSYKKMTKSLEEVNADLNSEKYKKYLRKQRILNLPNPSDAGTKSEFKYHSKKLKSQDKKKYTDQVKKLLDTLPVPYIIDDRETIPDYRLDFYLPNQKLAIEVLPIKEMMPKRNSQRAKTYCQKLMHSCNKQSIKLITLFQKHLNEPTWSKIMKTALERQILGHAEKTYYARQTVVKLIAKDKAKKFLNKWHIDGYTPSRYTYGVFAKKSKELLGVAAFGLPQVPSYKHQGLLELKRLGWRADVQVRYGISKIVSDIKKDLVNEYDGLITFSDNNIGQGKGYAKAGFSLLKESKPQLTYINPEHPEDHYSWSVATSWGARGGVIAQRLHPMNVDNQEAKRVVREELPWRIGSGQGYVPQYDTGNKAWIQHWRELN